MKTKNTLSKQRALDLQNSEVVNQLCDAVISKLTENLKQYLTFNQGVTGSNPVRPTFSKAFRERALSSPNM